MNVSQIFRKTMGFMWMKLGLGLATVFLASIWLFLLVKIGLFIGGGAGCMFIIVAFCTGLGGLIYALNIYIGYLVKAGHVAIVATAVTTGQIPDNQFEVAKDMVKERFGTANVYLVLDRLIARSVQQVQKVLQGAESLLGGIPGIGTAFSFLDLFVSISLNYVDECCLGYTFMKKDQNAFKSAADGVVIYVQNWKTLLKNALKTTFMVILFTILASVVPFFVLILLFKALGWNMFLALFLALMLGISIRYAFVDSYMMIKMMVCYMEVAPNTEISFDLYGKICGMSAKFKELLGKAEVKIGNMGGQAPQPAYAGGFNQPGQSYAGPMYSQSSQIYGQEIYCQPGQLYDDGQMNQPGQGYVGGQMYNQQSQYYEGQTYGQIVSNQHISNRPSGYSQTQQLNHTSSMNQQQGGQPQQPGYQRPYASPVFRNK